MEMCNEIAALKRQKYPERAQELLDRVYRFALPLMRKYSLKVKVLTEFFPKNPNLLGINVNRGQKIAIRLRHANSPNSFLHFEDVLATMLHELTHNRHGPHNEVFFTFLDRLKGEMQTMLNKGFKGDQWIGSGTKLGSRAGSSLGSGPAGRSAKSAAAAAAAARRHQGYKLGGETAAPINILDRRDKIVNAAERRRQVDKVCPADTLNEVEIIDLTRDVTPEVQPQSPHDPQTGRVIIDLT